MRIPRHLPAVVVVAAWLMFIGSFFLPATNVVALAGTKPGTPLTGGQSLAAALEVIAVQPLLVLIEPSTLLFLAFPFINLAMLVAPLVAMSREGSALLSLLLILSGVLPWMLPKEITGDLFVGFYLWDASFLVMSAGCVLANIRRSQASQEEIRAANPAGLSRPRET